MLIFSESTAESLNGEILNHYEKLAQYIMTTHVERIRAMAHAKAIFAVDNLKMSPIGEAVASQLVAGDITLEMAVAAIVERHHLRRSPVSSRHDQHAGFPVAQ